MKYSRETYLTNTSILACQTALRNGVLKCIIPRWPGVVIMDGNGGPGSLWWMPKWLFLFADLGLEVCWLDRNKLLNFLGTSSILNQGCTSAITFQSIGAAFKTMGAIIFISLANDDDLFPFTVWHCEMRQASINSLRDRLGDLYGMWAFAVRISWPRLISVCLADAYKTFHDGLVFAANAHLFFLADSQSYVLSDRYWNDGSGGVERG